MLLWNLSLLRQSPELFFLLVALVGVALLIALTFHEFSHALVADRLGDETPRRMGRLSLNPLAHLDPLGTLMLFLVGFGWGKPVPINPLLLRGDPRSGMGLVASAGPLANLSLAGLFAVPVRLELIPWHSPLALPLHPDLGAIIVALIGYIILFNLILTIFNLIPIAPLDGFKVLLALLPRNLAYSFERTERYGSMILLLFIFFGYFTGFLWLFLRSGVNLLALVFTGRAIL
ncbi:MAG: site-2 protease family protein [Chloroflexi bacterium]|nr:MAG: site-2 protease family protein [Chloroflexota bacterium]